MVGSPILFFRILNLCCDVFIRKMRMFSGDDLPFTVIKMTSSEFFTCMA